MAKRTSLYGKKKSRFLTTMMALTLIMCFTTAILSVGLVTININIYRQNKVVSEMQGNMSTIEAEINSVKAQEEEYKSKAQKLQQELSQYQPVVIPDSMKAK